MTSQTEGTIEYVCYEILKTVTNYEFISEIDSLHVLI